MPVNLQPYAEEIKSGLPNEMPLMDAALERQAFFDYNGFRYERHFRRDAESSFDFQGRSHRMSGFLNQCIRALCKHVYNPGPSRRWIDGGSESQVFLDKVYTDNFFDAIMLAADQLSTLNGTVAIQIDAGAGNYADKPLTYRLWGREEHCVWVDPDNANVPLVVCTRDKFDEQIRYRLWSDTECWTFLTAKLKIGEETTGGRLAELRSKEPHEYGCLPFSFVHYHLPIRTFDVVPVGEFLWKAEIHIDDRVSRLDESIHKHLNPTPWAQGMPESWKPDLEPQRFIRLPPKQPYLDASGTYQPGEYATLGYLQVTIDVAGAWDDLARYIRQALEAADIPESAVRMEQMGVASGISLMVEQEPLLKRATARRIMFNVYEHDIGKRSLLCAGNHYGIESLAKAAMDGHMVCVWPQPRLAVNTPDKLELIQGEVQAGFKSHLMAVQDWYGVGRDEALDIVEQIKDDEEELKRIFPELGAVKATQPPPEATQEGPAGQQEPTNPADPGPDREF